MKQEQNNNNELFNKFVNYIMLDGKKSVAKKIMNDTFEIIKSKGQKDPKGVFFKALENVMPRIEVRPKRVWGSIYQVPQEVRDSRQIFLAGKWIIEAARKKKWTQFAKFFPLRVLSFQKERKIGLINCININY